MNCRHLSLVEGDVADSLKIRENLGFLVYEIGGSFDFEVGFSTRRVATARDLRRGLLVRGGGGGRVSINVHGTIELETAKLR